MSPALRLTVAALLSGAVISCSGDAPPSDTGEDTIDRCADNVDNDHDGFVDCDDPRCSVFPAQTRPLPEWPRVISDRGSAVPLSHLRRWP